MLIIWRGRLGDLGPRKRSQQLWDKLSLDQGSILGRKTISCFSVEEGKIPMSLCPCTGCPACPIPLPSESPRVLWPVLCRASELSLPASAVLLKALCDGGGAAASILVLLGAGEAPCNGGSGSVWDLMPTWCRVCSLWLSLQSCEQPRAPQLWDPAGIFASLCPSSALFLALYFTLPCPPQASESSCLHRGGHDEENLFTSGCSAHAAGTWERAETRLPPPTPTAVRWSCPVSRAGSLCAPAATLMLLLWLEESV